MSGITYTHIGATKVFGRFISGRNLFFFSFFPQAYSNIFLLFVPMTVFYYQGM